MKKISILFFLFLTVFAFADTVITSSITEWGEEETESTYILSSDVTIADRIKVLGTVTLQLNSGCTLDADSGITVNNGHTLIIDGDGTLNASGVNGAGSGGYTNFNNCVTVIINGGTITATTEDYYSAGIGGGGGTINGNWVERIIINGGTVTARGGSGGAGIGGGRLSALLYCEINGGKVIAEAGGSGAAGIGGGDGSSWKGQYGACGTVIINGGEVIAQHLGFSKVKLQYRV